jgi:RND family efflux transporter MFP subunit
MKRQIYVPFLVVVVLMVVVAWGISARARAAASLQKETQQMAIPTLSVASPKRSDGTTEVVLPGSIQAFTDAAIYARIGGYLKRWYVDIGDKVKAGQLLAEIEAPEADQQLRQAQADLLTAQANAALAETTAARWQALLVTDSVTPQETDQMVGDRNAKVAMVESARANVKRLEELQSFEKIRAPFDGVITARNVDVGALIQVGTGTGTGAELFQLAATRTLRVYVNVPQVYSRSAVPGVQTEITLAELPSRRFKGTLVRTSDAIDPRARTLLAEVDIDNASGELKPGAYAQVHLKLVSTAGALVVPATALLFRAEGPRVVVVRNGKAELVPITIARDLGTALEIASGLTGNEQIVLNPPDAIVTGQDVNVAPSAPASAVSPSGTAAAGATASGK